MCYQVNLIVIGTVPSLILGILEQAVCEGDVDFIKYLLTKQGVDVNGEPLYKHYSHPHTWKCSLA